MKPKYLSARTRSFLPNWIQAGSAFGLILAASTAQATDFYKANNANNLNTSASWEDLGGTAFVEPTKPTNTSATSDTDIWTWDGRVMAANTVLTGGDLRVRTIRVINPVGLVTIDGGSPTNKTITVVSGGGIDMSNATQDLTIQNLSTSNSTVGLRLSSSGGNMAVNVATGRTLTLFSKITASGNGAGTTSTVNFTGPGTMICNAEMLANRLNIASGEVQLNLAGGSARPGNAATAFTNVNGGRLVVNNTAGSATGVGPVNINSTGTLTGGGIMTGAVTIASGGTIIPKENAVGSLTAGTLTLAAGSKVKWEGVDPSQADIVNVTGADGLTLNGGTVELYNVGTSQPFTGIGTFNLFSYTGAIGGIGTSSLEVAAASKIAGQTYTFGVAAGFVTLRIEVGSRPQSFWNVDANGNWLTAGSWTANGVPNGVSAIANLGGSQGVTTTAPRTVTLASGANVGVLNFNSAQQFTLAGSGPLYFDDGDAAATLHVENGNHVISTPLTFFGNGLLASVTNAANTLTVSGEISGSGSFSKSGAGTVVLSADNSYSGLTSIGAGVLQLGAGGATGSVSGSISTSGTLRINRSGAFTLGSESGGNFFGQISGSGGVDFAGTGTATLSVPNTFSGPTTISAGSVVVANSLALQNSTLTYSAGGGTLTFPDTITSVTLGGLSGNGSFPLTNALSTSLDLIVGQGNASSSYTGSTAGTGVTFTKTGTGTFSLSGTHAFSGATAINAGVLSLESGADFTSTAFTIGATAGAKLRLNGGVIHSGSLVMQNPSAGLEIAGGIANFSGGISNVNPGDSGAFFVNATGGTLNAGSMSLIRGGLSITTEPATGQTGNGLYINGGDVNITGALSIGGSTNSSVSTRMDSGSLTVGGPVTLAINNGGRWSVLDILGGAFTSSDLTTGVRLGGASLGQVIMHVRGSTAVVNAERFQFAQANVGGTSILDLADGKIFAGAGGFVVGWTDVSLTARLRLAGGTLGATADSTSDVPISITGSANVTGADSVNTPHTVTFSGAVDGAGSLTKSGSGTVNFTSPNVAITGTVTVTSGTLGIGGQTGAATVAAGGTLIPRGTLSPQAASTIGGTLGIRYDVGNSLAPGHIHSQGLLTLSAGSSLNVSGTGTLTNPAYVIASGAAGVSGTFTTVSGVPAGYSLVYNYNDGSGFPAVALVVATGSPYDSWASSFSLSGLNAGKNADPDNDGLRNLIEFGTGANPNQFTAGPVIGRSGNFLTLTFNHIADPTLIFSIETASSLAGPWTAVQTYPPFATAGTTVYTDTVAVGSTARRFLRLSALLP